MSRFSNRAEILFSRRAQVLGLFADILDYPAPGLATQGGRMRRADRRGATGGGRVVGELPRLRRGDSRSASFRSFTAAFLT